MKHTSLATRYRPQTFADVAGQELVTSVLSRAAAEDKVAPAYLLSGTRGVGKTTIARILAKALNCVNAPTGEPCNICDQCRKITQGNHVDVTEIDGASNNSVEDARALRENIGYAPMEGRYKVFIIDEAHMLSRSAFNALLKTLEEPPPRVVFIFATTEAHKFPITIVSRCQHFIFKRLPEAGLVAHLTHVLEAEKLPFDPSAVRLIARRAAGSVRDGMSLLGQTLALGGESLTVEATRTVLGLAGQDMFARLLDALISQDCLAVSLLLREMLDQGVDIGFFLRELTSLWRTLFLVRQAGAAVLPALDIPEDEARLWMEQAPRLSLTHIHAAWQMVLDAQRRVIHSPEPAAALELLLLNVALLPRLLPLEHMPGGAAGLATPPLAGTAPPAQPKAVPTVESATLKSCVIPTPVPKAEPADTPAPQLAPPSVPQSVPATAPQPALSVRQGAAQPNWQDFHVYCAEHSNGQCPQHILRQSCGVFTGNTLTLTIKALTLFQQIERMQSVWEQLASEYCGQPMQVCIEPPTHLPKTEAELKEAFAQREELKPLIDIFDARISRCPPLSVTAPTGQNDTEDSLQR